MIFNRLALLNVFAVAAFGSEGLDDGDRNLRLGPNRASNKVKGRSLSAGDDSSSEECDVYQGSGKQKFTSLPPGYPNSALPGDEFVSVVDKPLFDDIIDFGINTCTIVTFGPPFDTLFPSYELSCHLLAKGSRGTFTASGDGASSGILDFPQQTLYAITGGTGEFLGAYGEVSFSFQELVLEDPVIGLFVSEFDFTLTLCL